MQDHLRSICIIWVQLERAVSSKDSHPVLPSLSVAIIHVGIWNPASSHWYVYVIMCTTSHTTPYYFGIHFRGFKKQQKLWIPINIIIHQLNNILHPSINNLQLAQSTCQELYLYWLLLYLIWLELSEFWTWYRKIEGDNTASANMLHPLWTSFISIYEGSGKIDLVMCRAWLGVCRAWAWAYIQKE
jgi:hypothetical protein